MSRTYHEVPSFDGDKERGGCSCQCLREQEGQDHLGMKHTKDHRKEAMSCLAADLDVCRLEHTGPLRLGDAWASRSASSSRLDRAGQDRTAHSKPGLCSQSELYCRPELCSQPELESRPEVYSRLELYCRLGLYCWPELYCQPELYSRLELYSRPELYPRPLNSECLLRTPAQWACARNRCCRVG